MSFIKSLRHSLNKNKKSKLKTVKVHEYNKNRFDLSFEDEIKIKRNLKDLVTAFKPCRTDSIVRMLQKEKESYNAKYLLKFINTNIIILTRISEKPNLDIDMLRLTYHILNEFILYKDITITYFRDKIDYNDLRCIQTTFDISECLVLYIWTSVDICDD